MEQQIPGQGDTSRLLGRMGTDGIVRMGTALRSDLSARESPLARRNLSEVGQSSYHGFGGVCQRLSLPVGLELCL